jgi:surface antigen
VTLLAAMALAAAVPGANAASGAASGGNIGFLKDAPLTRFTGADLEMFRQNLNAALEQNADGEVRRWQNADTGSAGEIELVGSFTRDGKRCRTVWISNRARGYAEARTDAVFCRGTDGAWKTSPPPKPAAPTK